MSPNPEMARLHRSATVGMVGDACLSRLTAHAGQELGIDVKLLRPDQPQACEYDVISCCGAANNSSYLRSMAAAGHTVRPSPRALELRSSNPLAREALLHVGFHVRPDHRHGDPLPTNPQLPRTTLADRRLVVVLVARRPSGWTVTYPVAEDVQESPAGPATVVPARISDGVADLVTATARSMVDGLNASGIVAVRMLVSPLNTAPLIIIDIHSGPQYSGLFTIDVAATSQFDNHLRAILDWPLGSTQLYKPAAATIRVHRPVDPTLLHRSIPHALANPDIRIHVHPGPRNSRSIHVTALGESGKAALSAAHAAACAFAVPTPLLRH